MKSRRRRGLLWALVLGVILCTAGTACAAEWGGYEGHPEAWGMTEDSGTLGVFCRSDTIDLDVRNLGSGSVVWTDKSAETDRILVRAVDDGSMELHFTLPGG
jgi:hypothetical protein